MFHTITFPKTIHRITKGLRQGLATLTLIGITAAVGFAGGPSGVVYVQSNIGDVPGQNSILAFQRNAQGKLSPLPGSPFLTLGTGVTPTLDLGPFDSDQNIITNDDGNLLFSVNSGSNTIAVFDILNNGALVHVKGSPFLSGGINPVSVGLAGSFLCVVNKNMNPGQDPGGLLPNYTTLRVNPQGRLIRVPFAAVEVPLEASPTQALTDPSVQLLFGADFFGELLQSFQILPNGRLFQNPPQSLPDSEFQGINAAVPRFPLGMQRHPEEAILYVGFVTINRLGVYTYDETGNLEFVRSVPNEGQAICWLITNQLGDRLYSTNTGDNTVSVYDLSDPLEPVEIQTLRLAGADASPFQLGLDPTGRFLHVVSQAAAPGQGPEANALHVLKVDASGLLEQVDRVVLPSPGGSRPQGILAF